MFIQSHMNKKYANALARWPGVKPSSFAFYSLCFTEDIFNPWHMREGYGSRSVCLLPSYLLHPSLHVKKLSAIRLSVPLLTYVL